MTCFTRPVHIWTWGFSFFILVAALSCGANDPIKSFVTIQDTKFVLEGSPFLFNGFNSYWMMNVAAEPTERHKISEVFRDASAAALTVCRTWAFADGGSRALQLSPGVYDERVFQALDFVVSEAQKYGVRLVLSLINNYNDYGGRLQYAQWAKSAGVPVKNDDDFYTHPVIKGFYKNHVKTVLARINTISRIAYKDDPTIMAWELINEPRCQLDYSGKTVNDWVQEMATYIKSLDNKHLLEIGMEGFYGDSVPEKKQFNPGYQVGTDFISNHLIKEIDFTTIHAYPDIWLSGQDDNAQIAFVQKWISSHLEDSKTVIKKPLVFSEFGKSSRDPGYTLNARNTYLNTIYMDIYDEARTGGIGGGLVWQLVAGGMESYFDGYEINLADNPSTDRLITSQSQKMTALSHNLKVPQAQSLAFTEEKMKHANMVHGHGSNRKFGNHGHAKGPKA